MSKSGVFSAKHVERAMQVAEVLQRVQNKTLSTKEAALVLGVSTRTVRRYKARAAQAGHLQLIDKRCIRPSPKRLPKALREQVCALYRTRYYDFNVTHFVEKLRAKHDITASYSWVKSTLQKSGLVSKGKKRNPHRQRRERRAMRGVMLHLDGSSHRWLGPTGPQWDLLVVLDDADSRVLAARFVDEESTPTCLAILREVVERHGAFGSLYTDRASHFVRTIPGRKALDKKNKTQVARALAQLGTTMIFAHSPQARGRSERLFGTWQDRLVSEMRLAKVTTMAQANAFLQTHFIAWHNAHLTVTPSDTVKAFRKVECVDLDRIFAIHHHRVVAKDNTVAFNRQKLQLRADDCPASMTKRRVTVYEHGNGLLTVGYGEQCLGCFAASDGRWLAPCLPKTTTRKAA